MAKALEEGSVDLQSGWRLSSQWRRSRGHPKGKAYTNQKKNVPVGIDCDALNTFHSISHATLLDDEAFVSFVPKSLPFDPCASSLPKKFNPPP